jgi:iron(III) transport system substrate-binding protein
VLLYNSAAIPPAEAPGDWDDLLAPRFTDQVLIRDPLASGTMRTFFGMIVARSVTSTGDTRQGFDWLLRLDAQTKEYVLNPALMIEKMMRQEGLITVWELTDALWQGERGAPLAFAVPASGTPIIVDSIGLVAGAPHPEEAKRFIDWVGGSEAQLLAAREAFRLPARNDLPREELPEWARRVIDTIVPADVDRELIERYGPDWMTTWDRTVRGQGRRRGCKHCRLAFAHGGEHGCIVSFEAAGAQRRDIGPLVRRQHGLFHAQIGERLHLCESL